jgi:adenylate cyclase
MWHEESPQGMQTADECSLRALQLAPELAEAHASRSYAMTANSNYGEAEAAFKKAIELDPQLYEAYYYAGRAYFAQGEFRKAADAFEQAGMIRPDDPTPLALRSTALKAVGTEAEILLAHQHALEVSERYLSLNPDDALAWSRAANDLILTGEIEKGLSYADRALALQPSFCRYNVACAYELAGKTDRALELLEEHANSGAVLIDWLLQDSDWDGVRDDPRFQAIVEKLS